MCEGGAAGIDIGSVAIALVLLDGAGAPAYRDYQNHQGNISATLAAMLARLPVDRVASFGVVAEKGREFFTAGFEVNEQVALIAGIRQQVPAVRSLIAIGGETFCLILLDAQGRYRKYIANSACAAGTGSFLDQQSSRLGLSGSAELSDLAASWQGDPPKIATRCAVFAKTDLMHIQQQGYGLPAIAAGLCQGVARNISDTLFHGVELAAPVVVAGGVSRNGKVVQYLQEMLGQPLTVPHDGELMGAVGAALLAQGRQPPDAPPLLVRGLLMDRPQERSYHYAPLAQTAIPPTDFSSWHTGVLDGVEVDIYQPLADRVSIDCYLGIDVGSTSTKAALIDGSGQVVAGLYTRTGGQPVTAVQRLTRALATIEKRFAANFVISGTATTGAGRKFIQRVARADFSVDEITAHARAAYHLDPAIDTIIEIGGQDAKFTVLNNGNVTFAVMNHVCAAGTGSFIEEQARRLGVALTDFAQFAQDAPAPLISDRCTVFMERDINHLLALGYRREELAAAALHSVRDNYLSKVAHLNKIGSHIAFQGATAKNHALVRAFAQRLRKPVHVSRYCHLTGALGACLKLADGGARLATRFRRQLHDEQVVIDEYVCEYCQNHCKIKCTEIDGEMLGWGYLCGRDEQNAGYRSRVETGFDLLHHHRRIFAMPDKADARRELGLFEEFEQGGISAVIRRPGFSLDRLRDRIQFNFLEMRDELFSSGIVPRRPDGEPAAVVSIGLPATLTMLEFLPLWQLFFQRLGFTPVTAAAGPARVAQGKAVCGAEYCAPLMDFHGHIRELAARADYIFYPQIIEHLDIGAKKTYCYYSHYAVPLVHAVPGLELNGRLLAPLLKLDDNIDDDIRQLYLSLPEALKARTSYDRVAEAFLLAWDWYRERTAALQELYRNQLGASRDIAVVLLGRPYLVLNPGLNKRIPGQLAALGVQTFFMDMIPVEDDKLETARDFLALNHWQYGDRIIKAATMAAQTPGLFPVFLTAFKCSPDSFIISYFKAIMDYYRKPYLVLQLDDHEAAEGYETRLEAAVESFRNYRADDRRGRLPAVHLQRTFADKTYLLPGYEPLSARFIQGAFIGAGRKAMLVEQPPETIRNAMAINDGQCLPVSILTEGIRHTVRAHKLDPAQTAFYSTSDSPLSCNLPQFPVMIKQQLEQMGGGLEQIDILVSGFVPAEASLQWKYEIYLAYLLAGLLQKMTYRLRPREVQAGATDAVLAAAVSRLSDCFAANSAKEPVLQGIVEEFRGIAVRGQVLPQVGIVGDVFVRDNDILNCNLVREIERAGAEAVTIPFADAMDLIADSHFRNQWHDGRYLDLLQDKMAYNALQLFSNRLVALAQPVLGDRPRGFRHDPDTYREKYAFSVRHGGETAENLLKIFYLRENFPALKFIVNVNPIFCCPGLISEGLYRKVEQDIGLPIVSITYDGSAADRNRVIRPYLHFLH